MSQEIVFIGVTTAQSSIMRIFPRWRDRLGLGASVQLVGWDVPIQASPERYRALIQRIREDSNIIGGVATEQPILDPEMRTFTWAHLLPGMFSPTGTMQAAGSSYQWARDELAAGEQLVAERLGRSPYWLMDHEVRQSPPGARGLLFLPYLLGERSPRWNPQARGAFVGLTIRHKHADMLRAVLEGITFNLRVILEAFRGQGTSIEALRVIGGGARGAIWNEIMADIFGLPVLRLSLLEEATSMGAAVAGGVGVGLWKDFSQVEQMIQIEREALPDPRHRHLYDELYGIFNQIYSALDGAAIFSKLAAAEV